MHFCACCSWSTPEVAGINDHNMVNHCLYQRIILMNRTKCASHTVNSFHFEHVFHFHSLSIYLISIYFSCGIFMRHKHNLDDFVEKFCECDASNATVQTWNGAHLRFFAFCIYLCSKTQKHNFCQILDGNCWIFGEAKCTVQPLK